MARSHLCLNSLTCYFFMLLRFSSHLDMCTHTIWLLLPLSYTHTAHSVDSTRRSEKRISGTRYVRWQVRRRKHMETWSYVWSYQRLQLGERVEVERWEYWLCSSHILKDITLSNTSLACLHKIHKDYPNQRKHYSNRCQDSRLKYLLWKKKDLSNFLRIFNSMCNVKNLM